MYYGVTIVWSYFTKKSFILWRMVSLNKNCSLQVEAESELDPTTPLWNCCCTEPPQSPWHLCIMLPTSSQFSYKQSQLFIHTRPKMISCACCALHLSSVQVPMFQCSMSCWRGTVISPLKDMGWVRMHWLEAIKSAANLQRFEQTKILNWWERRSHFLILESDNFQPQLSAAFCQFLSCPFITQHWYKSCW